MYLKWFCCHFWGVLTNSVITTFCVTFLSHKTSKGIFSHVDMILTIFNIHISLTSCLLTRNINFKLSSFHAKVWQYFNCHILEQCIYNTTMGHTAHLNIGCYNKQAYYNLDRRVSSCTVFFFLTTHGMDQNKSVNKIMLIIDKLSC